MIILSESMTTGIIYHEKYLEHNLGLGHPESPERLKKTMELLKKIIDKPNIELLKPNPASEEDLLRVHTKSYVEKIKSMSRTGGVLTLDTPVPSGVYEIAKLSAGGAMLAGKSVCEKRVDNAFALIRPPGHHAGRDFGGGFCYFNNVAIAVKSIQEMSIKKVLILDIDAHAGNGTMDIFWEDNSVLYLSLHQWSAFPGTGWYDQVGEKDGEGFTINLPLFPYTGDDVYLKFFREFAIPIINQFNPELIAVSTGFDTHKLDPLTNMNLSLNSYHEIGKFLHGLNKRIFIVLEGGYNLDILPKAILVLISSLQGNKIIIDESPTVSSKEIREKSKKRVKEIEDLLSKYWVF